MFWENEPARGGGGGGGALTALNVAIQVKHTVEALVNWGSDLYKSIYFLMWMFWIQSKENIVIKKHGLCEKNIENRFNTLSL